ncbi:hypothetical protein yc1106_05242 [Curvularia clavata]|uniref:Uncharacterized protein n=1 Tax=Curvularia clavata TaxID=95742 RepID=A0A9Q8ZBY0_CURCL|nr:hypothetical protein yc1106_05242 [Curvularia clavata]
MQFTTFATLFTAAAVLGAPTEPTKSMSIAALGETVFDQGDGFYLASYNDAGALKVNFTPMAELDTTTPPAEHLTTRSTHLLSKRETVCSGRTSVNLGNLDAANVQLAKNAAAQVTYNGGAWGWVHNGGETSYFCNYATNYLTYQLIIDMHTVVSGRCGQNGYGYDRRRGGGGANDLSVGRTFRGDHFCDDSTHG